MDDDFAPSRAKFGLILSRLESEEAADLTHAELEELMATEGRELIRQMLQDHLRRRAALEPRLEAVVDAEGVPRGNVEEAHARSLTTVFGQVEVERLAYRRRGHANLHPADGALNLPEEEYSHGLRKLAAIEAPRGSFDDAVAAIERAAGIKIGKRQVEELTARAAVDVEAFYEQRRRAQGEAAEVLVLSCDGKGIVMRPEALRAGTRRAAARASPKLETRLSRGEKRNRKRMAEVGCVYDARPVPRKPTDILVRSEDREHPVAAPVAARKWLVASVVEDAAAVVARLFDEAERRDPEHRRTWIALVDGNNHQLDRIRVEARRRGVGLTVVIDFVHVLEYLWKAAWSFYAEGDPAAEAWVREQALAVLAGKATRVAGRIRRRATRERLEGRRREGADACADYLTNKRLHLDYPTALASGWPISSGVIEGACRHLVKDRMDLTGARWGLAGAEAVLRLRTLHANGDFEAYWRFHLAHEQRRVHASHYRNELIPGMD